MHLSRIAIKNFRLLTDVEVLLEERTTVVVGRNNSGKTSLTELFRRLLSDVTPKFTFEDFSLSSHAGFWAAFDSFRKMQEEAEVRKHLPVIAVSLTVDYKAEAGDLGFLGDLVVDLNPETTSAVAVFRYQLGEGQVSAFFDGLDIKADAEEKEQRRILCKAMQERVPQHFVSSLEAVDPGDPSNKRKLEFSTLRNLIHSGFINAQRGLDDTTHKDINLLGKVLETLFVAAQTGADGEPDHAIATALETAVGGIQEEVDASFNKKLQELLPTFGLFGYPGLSDPRLLTETTLDVHRLLRDHTRVHYEGANGVNLPETYNGLGVRNLVFILLKLYEFFKCFQSEEHPAGMHLIFIEEPEVHLHPQMQEVFITQLGAIAAAFAKHSGADLKWPAQFVVTTHSSHLANKAALDSMRYFLQLGDPLAAAGCHTSVKNLKNLTGVEAADRDFLHKYMTLTRCDLLFADKAVLIEGTTERLLLPKMMDKVDAGVGPGLRSQYISVVEVGGAYAHIFFNLLDFLEVPTLVITDLDSVKDDGDGNLVACQVSQGTHTSNACLKKWFNDDAIAPAALLAKTDAEKTHSTRRLCYEVPEDANAPCGRSFEDAFILANPALFPLKATDKVEREEEAWAAAARVGKKSDFALEHAIRQVNWTVPRYIAEGLGWLTKIGRVGPVGPLVMPALVGAPAPAAPVSGGLMNAPAKAQPTTSDSRATAAGDGSNG